VSFASGEFASGVRSDITRLRVASCSVVRGFSAPADTRYTALMRGRFEGYVRAPSDPRLATTFATTFA
jgi:hypothetical protein